MKGSDAGDSWAGRQRLGSESGVALVLALIVLALVTLVGMSLSYNSVIDNMIVMNNESGTQAHYIAEAGLNHAVDIVITNTNLNAFLAGSDGNASTMDDNGILEGSIVPAGRQSIPKEGGLTFGKGRYEVRLYDDDYDQNFGKFEDFRWTGQVPEGLPDSDPRYGLREDGNLYNDVNGRVIIRSTGFAPNNTTVTLEAIIGKMPMAGILIEKDLEISGNPVFNGDSGSIHANGNLKVSGDPTVEGSVTASGGTLEIDESDRDRIENGGGYVGYGTEPRIEVPLIKPEDYKAQADYILKADGKVYNGAGGFLFDTTSGNPYGGWKRSSSSPVVWDHSGATFFPGTYYIEGTAIMSSNVGTRDNPVNVTLLATSSIEISGNPYMNPDVAGVLMVSGKDVKINGNPDQSFMGLIYAYEHLGISGDPTINGNFIAKNATDGPAEKNLIDKNYISGNPTVTFYRHQSLITGLISWRDIRN